MYIDCVLWFIDMYIYVAVQFTGTIIKPAITCKQFLEFHAKNTHEPAEKVDRFDSVQF